MAGCGWRPGRSTRRWTGLRDTGLIDIDHEEIVDGRARRYYRLTGAGREALRTEARRMARAAKLFRRHARAEQ